MDVIALFLTHSIARNEGKSPFFFSRFNFQRMKERGNTHYCFDCGGSWGFTPGKNGEATNCEDDKITLHRSKDDVVKVKEALKDKNLEPHLADSPGYPRRKPGDRMYENWLEYSASFDYSDEFIKWCKENGYTVYRYNPMGSHDPVTHAEAVVNGADKYNSAYEWFENIKLPDGFPYIVNLR